MGKRAGTIQREGSGSANGQVMMKLRAVMLAAAAKINKNRFKDVPGKWHPNGFSELGERIWSRTPTEWLCRKLGEEFAELIFEVAQSQRANPNILDEAGDVMALAMMIADNSGSIWDPPPEIVTLCGSTKFKEDFLQAQYEETMAGRIVLTVGFYHHVDAGAHRPELAPEDKIGLDVLHKRKIDISDSIYVINRDDYIGESTRSEIEHARERAIPIRYMFPHKVEVPDDIPF